MRNESSRTSSALAPPVVANARVPCTTSAPTGTTAVSFCCANAGAAPSSNSSAKLLEVFDCIDLRGLFRKFLVILFDLAHIRQRLAVAPALHLGRNDFDVAPRFFVELLCARRLLRPQNGALAGV